MNVKGTVIKSNTNCNNFVQLLLDKAIIGL